MGPFPDARQGNSPAAQARAVAAPAPGPPVVDQFRKCCRPDGSGSSAGPTGRTHRNRPADGGRRLAQGCSVRKETRIQLSTGWTRAVDSDIAATSSSRTRFQSADRHLARAHARVTAAAVLQHQLADVDRRRAVEDAVAAGEDHLLAQLAPEDAQGDVRLGEHRVFAEAVAGLDVGDVHQVDDQHAALEAGVLADHRRRIPVPGRSSASTRSWMSGRRRICSADMTRQYSIRSFISV